MRADRSRRGLVVERLENRRLLAADWASLDGGVLTIEGTNRSDRIDVALVTTESGTQIVVTGNGKTSAFDAAEVTSIEIFGNNGNDWITIDAGVTAGATIYGGAGNDRIVGGGGDDRIFGEKGNDRLWGGGGDDVISGGDGNDWIWGDAGDDVLHGDKGNDHLLGGADNDTLYGDDGHDRLHGEDGDDILYGGLNKDHLRGGLGNDQLFGEENKDHLWGDDGDDWLVGGDDNDHLWGGLGNDLLKGGSGNDHLDGGAGTNFLDGDTGRDKYKNGLTTDLDGLLIATLGDPGDTSALSAVAKFEPAVVNGQVVWQLHVTVKNGTPGQVLDVAIDGTTVGSITVGGDGQGSLILSSEDLLLLLPGGVANGSTIEIIDAATSTVLLSGAFAAALV